MQHFINGSVWICSYIALDIIYILLYEMRSVIADAASDTYREDLSSTVGGRAIKIRTSRVTTSLRFISLVAFVINHQVPHMQSCFYTS